MLVVRRVQASLIEAPQDRLSPSGMNGKPQGKKNPTPRLTRRPETTITGSTGVSSTHRHTASGAAMQRNLAACLVAGLLASSAFAATAQTTAASADVPVDTRSAEPASGDEPQPAVDRLCPRTTGTRIVARDDGKGRCNTFGRVHTSDDLQRTGASNLGDALRKLDPAIR